MKKNKNNFLDYVPQIQHENWVVEKDRVKLIFEHNGPIERVVQKIFKKPAVTDITLDELGSVAWCYIDDKRNVREIGEVMCEKHQQNQETIFKQLSIFFGYLYRQKWITFTANK